jgi:hypothetical protein
MIRKRSGKLLRMTQNGTIGTSFACATETIIGSVDLPGNFLISGAIILIRANFIKTGTTSQITLKLYFNTSESLTGALLLGTGAAALTSDLSPYMYRVFCFGSESTSRGLNSSFAAANDIGDIATTVDSFSFTEWLPKGGKFFITGLRAAGTDTIQSLGITIEV